MTPRPDEYLKASDYDLEKQRHNRAVFHRELQRNPRKALALSLALAGLSLALFWLSGQHAGDARATGMRYLLAPGTLVGALYLAALAWRSWR